MPIHLSIKSSAEKESEKAAAEAIRAKADHLIEEWSTLVKRLQANWISVQDVVAAGRLFNVEIKLPADYPRSAPSMRFAIPDTAPIPKSPPGQPTLFESTGETTIREAVLEQLKMAGEKGAKASSIRRVIESMIGRQLHYKTVGMTLYRLSERGLVRREGYFWFITPEGVKTKTPAS
jgi:hypothetical protein